MAWSKHHTLLAPDEWASIMGIDPWTWNQFGVGFPEGSQIGIQGNDCRDVFYQYPWQRNAISVDEVALAIQRAEKMLADVLTFYPAPKYILDEPIQYPHRIMPYAYGYGAWAYVPLALSFHRGYSPSVQTSKHKIQAGGTLARTSIGDTNNLTLSDSDGDGVYDTFTCSIATTVTDPDEIGVYFRAANRVPANSDVSETWRIRPVRVSISSGVATITGHSALLGVPALRTITNPEPLDVTDAANYVTQVSVYRLYTDTTNAGTAIWEAEYPCVSDPCEPTTETLCMGDRNWNMGRTYIAFNHTEDCSHWRAPEQVKLNYLAGEALVNGQMKPEYAQFVAHLATGLLPNFPCGCDRANKIVEWWRFDVSSQDQQVGGRPLTPDEMQSPFGYSRGALYVWAQMANNQQITGVIV